MSNNFISYIAWRVVGCVPTVLGIILVAFLLITLAPGNPVDILAGGMGANPEFYARMQDKFGLNRPLWVRVSSYFGEILRGNFGYSYTKREPVIRLILDRVPATILLGLTALFIAAIAGILIGTAQATRLNSIWDLAGTFVSVTGYSIPLFWLGHMLIFIFAFQLRWFPLSGMVDVRGNLVGVSALLDILHHLILPAFTLGAFQMALIARVTRSSLCEVIKLDYITVARAKGLLEQVVLYKHALRNALLPVVTIIGMDLGFLFAGSLLVETVFAWPGVGRLMYQALLQRDYSLLTGIFMMVALATVVGNLLTDISYAVLDPRVKFE